MGGYTKNIAVIKGLKEGFSADGGDLTGLVKAEKYGNNLKVEVTFINFAPLSEGRYVTGLSDGNTTIIIENGLFEGYSALNTGSGFAALICYVNGTVSPIASAVSGGFNGAALGIKTEIEKAENIKPADGGVAAVKENAGYEDEAIAEVNYYEFAKTVEGGGALFQGAQEEENGYSALQNEAAVGSFQKGKNGVDPDICQSDGGFSHKGGLAGGQFYEKMKNEIEGILSAYPAEDSLEKIVENSKWVKISYGDGKFYVFGVIYVGGKPQYICYGVPASNNTRPPESMQGLASFIPSSLENPGVGFWIMYQDANTGASLKIDIQ